MAERRIRSATPSGKKPTPAQDALGLDQRLFHLAVGVITDFMFVGDMRTGRLDWYGDVDATLGYAPGAGHAFREREVSGQRDGYGNDDDVEHIA
jgi:hypothetical protein